MDKILLFEECTSKVDLISNNRLIAKLDDIATNCIITPSMDSNFILNMTIDCNDEGLYKRIDKKQILKVLHQNSYEYFVIVALDKGLDSIEIVARHWTTEATLNIFLKDLKPRNLGSLAMLDHLKTNSEEYKLNRQYARDIEVGGNITSQVSTNFYHKNLYEGISELVPLYNGEVKREGFKVELVDHIGSKTPKYTVEYGVNLIDNIQSENWDIATGCITKGFDGVCSPVVYSGLLTNNPNLMGQTIEVDTKVRVREEGEADQEGYIYFNTQAEAIAELTKIATEQFTKVGIDKPKIEFSTKFIDLSTTEEYKDMIKSYINIGDVVRVKIVKYNNLDVNVRVFSYVYNVLSQEIDDITLTNNSVGDMTPPTINSVKKEVDKKPSINDVIETARKESEAIVNQGFNGFVHYRPNFTAWTDTKDIKLSKKGLCANKNGWFFYKNGINAETGVPNTDGSTMIADVDGNFNASVISTGELNANLIRAGIIKDVLENMVINLDNGTVSFKKGFIQGRNMKLDLDSGEFECNYGVDKIRIKDGELFIGDHIRISQNRSGSFYIKDINSDRRIITYWGNELCMFGEVDNPLTAIDGNDVVIRANNRINFQAPTVSVNGSPLNTRFANIENAMLQQEGLI